MPSMDCRSISPLPIRKNLIPITLQINLPADCTVCSNAIYHFRKPAGNRDAGMRLTGSSRRSATNLCVDLSLPKAASCYSDKAADWTFADLMLKRLCCTQAAELRIIEGSELRFH